MEFGCLQCVLDRAAFEEGRDDGQANIFSGGQVTSAEIERPQNERGRAYEFVLEFKKMDGVRSTGRRKAPLVCQLLHFRLILKNCS